MDADRWGNPWLGGMSPFSECTLIRWERWELRVQIGGFTAQKCLGSLGEHDDTSVDSVAPYFGTSPIHHADRPDWDGDSEMSTAWFSRGS